jgi:hypothetical protein
METLNEIGSPRVRREPFAYDKTMKTLHALLSLAALAFVALLWLLLIGGAR